MKNVYIVLSDGGTDIEGCVGQSSSYPSLLVLYRRPDPDSSLLKFLWSFRIERFVNYPRDLVLNLRRKEKKEEG